MPRSKPLVPLRAHEDSRGLLVAVESSRDLPFQIERVYYIVGTSGESRGFHAHKSLRQLMIAVAGSCSVLLDNGRERCTYILRQPDTGLFVDAMIWHEMHDFTPDCVLLVLASAKYDETDYIRDYGEFIGELRRGVP